MTETAGTVEISDRYERGKAVLASMNNDPTGMAAWRAVDPVVGPKLDRLLGEFCFGDVWAGDGLDKRTRRVITLASLATQGRTVQLDGHLRSALEQGFSRTELLEIFLHLVPYTGFPTVLTAVSVADAVFNDIDAKDAARP
jgi:4-carboxymuconolactone decarboxylase